MGDKVNAAVKFCGLRMGQLRNLLGEATYDPQSCAWMSGLNVIDLEKWREYNGRELPATSGKGLFVFTPL